MRTQSKKQQQQQQHQILSSELFKNSKIHKNHFEILTFLKSNYKYKRRCRRCSVTAHPVQAAEMQVKQCFGSKGVASTAKSNTCCHYHHNNKNNNDNNITQEINTKSDKSSFNLINFSFIFIFLSIVANIIYRKLLLPLQRHICSSARSADSQQQIVAVTLDAIAAPCLDCIGVYNNDVNNDADDDDSDETRCQQNYDKLSTLGCQSRPPRRHNATLRQRRATWAASMLQQPQFRRGSAVASDAPLLPLEIDSHIHVMPIFMTLFIALALSVRCAEGGACWQKTLSNGKCNEIFSLNITKADCCSTNQEFSYTEKELSSVEYFFATAIGGGMECAPCLESCKNVNCGPNKKCAKRKGRPKCICAPECGAATRKRKKAKQFRGTQNQQQHHSDISLRPIQRNLDAAVIFGKSARDIRSLSSEIQSQNIELDDEAGRRRDALGLSNSWALTATSDAVFNRRNSSQRKLIVMQNQARAQSSKREHKEHSMLLIVEPPVEADEEKTTTRRLQVISNVNNNNNNKNHKNRNNPSGRKRNRNEKERLHKQEELQKTTTKESTIQSTSRHKPNGKKKNKNNSNNNNNNNNNNNLQQTKNFDVNNAKLRHIQQNARQLEDGPNRDQQQQQQQQQQKQQQHHGRHHQFRKRKKKLHNQLKDQNAVSAAEIDHEQLAGATTVTMSGSNAKATKTKSATNTTPANSSSSSLSSSTTTTTEQQRLFKHGSTLATSSSSATSLPTLTMVATSSSSASSSSSAWSPSGEADNRHNQSRTASISRSFFNSDDLTFDDRIYDKFNLHGFPNPEHKYTQLDRIHSSHHHHHHPVCGTDGRTYNTECQLKKRACRTDNTELIVAYQGHCKTTCNGVKCLNGLTCVEDHYTIPHCIACRTDCPLDDLDDFGAADDGEIQAQRAVCGVDGKTYRSVCDINRMICKIGRSIGVAYPGPCRDDRVTCSDINCGSKRTCLVDLLTHEPRCVSCRYKCSRKRRPTSVRYEEGKICGANNRTYNSWCEMRKDSCATGFYIDVKKLGVCQ